MEVAFELEVSWREDEKSPVMSVALLVVLLVAVVFVICVILDIMTEVLPMTLVVFWLVLAAVIAVGVLVSTQTGCSWSAALFPIADEKDTRSLMGERPVSKTLVVVGAPKPPTPVSAGEPEKSAQELDWTIPAGDA